MLLGGGSRSIRGVPENRYRTIFRGRRVFPVSHAFHGLCFFGESRAICRRNVPPFPIPQDDGPVAMVDTAYFYLAFYRQSLFRAWDNLTPMQYVSLLITIAVVGYLSMRGVSHK